METQLCKLVRDFRELKEDIERVQCIPVAISGIVSRYDLIVSEIMDLIQIPKKQQELFWILVAPDKSEKSYEEGEF